MRILPYFLSARPMTIRRPLQTVLKGMTGAYLDEERINSGYDSVIKTLIGDSGLTYTYSDYKYKISFEK